MTARTPMQLRRDRATALRADPTLAPHGSSSTYQNWACRCAPCTVAQRVVRAAWVHAGANARRCDLAGCTEPHHAHGLCLVHYARDWRRRTGRTRNSSNPRRLHIPSQNRDRTATGSVGMSHPRVR